MVNKTKALSWAVIGLVVLNALAITALILGRPGGPMGPGANDRHGGPNPGDQLIRRLKFDHEQAQALHKLINDHRDNILEKEGQMNVLRTRMFSLLITDTYEARDALIEEIAIVQKDIEEIHFQHFLAIKRLCKEEQLPIYNELARELKIGTGKPQAAGIPSRR